MCSLISGWNGILMRIWPSWSHTPKLHSIVCTTSVADSDADLSKRVGSGSDQEKSWFPDPILKEKGVRIQLPRKKGPGSNSGEKRVRFQTLRKKRSGSDSQQKLDSFPTHMKNRTLIRPRRKNIGSRIDPWIKIETDPILKKNRIQSRPSRKVGSGSSPPEKKEPAQDLQKKRIRIKL